MPITRATNLAGLGTIFDSLTDGGGLSVSGISTFTDLNITRVNVTGVGTISNGSITNLTGTAATITTFTSTNGFITNLTGTSSTITTLRSTTGNFTTGNIVTGVTTNFNATNVVITGVTTVSAGTTALPSISPSGDPNTGVFFPAADTIAFSEGGAEAVRIDASGRLLVGTTSSSSDSVIVVQGYAGVSVGAGEISITRGGTPSIADQGLGTIRFQNNNNNTGAQIDAFSEGSWTGGSNHRSRLVFSTTSNSDSSPTERMRISQNGQTRILGAVGANGAALTWENTVNSSGAFAGVSFLGSNANNTSSYHYIAATGGADKFYVFGNGNVVNINNSYGSLSDLKIKENIIDATSQWSDIKNLQVRKYNFKEETGHQTHTQIGIIAQEVELISPGLVNESPDRDAEGNELDTVTKSVNYSVLYMKAVKALQEAMERIEQLESVVASIQGN